MDFVLSVISPVIAGVIVLIIEYRTGWFAKLVDYRGRGSATVKELPEERQRIEQEIQPSQVVEQKEQPSQVAVQEVPLSQVKQDIPSRPEVLDVGKPEGHLLLSPWNPLDYFRLLWWLLVIPQRLEAYPTITSDGRTVIRAGLGSWLASTLIWLPLLIPYLALGVQTLPRVEGSLSPTAYLCISLGLALAWALTGWKGETNDEMAGGIGWIIVLAAAGGVAQSVGYEVVFVVSLGMALFVGGIVVDSVASGRVGKMAMIIVFGPLLIVGTLGTAWGVISVPISLLASESMPGSVLSLVSGLASWVVLFILIALRVKLEKSLETGCPHWLTKGALGALVLAYTFLVWFSFLSGWRVFQ